MSRPLITLTTDFGLADSYVAAMKGVIFSICPEATVVDVSHEIRPQAVGQAAYVLATAAAYFPPGTVHVVVVDPGVGTRRRAVAVQTGRALYVAPDNGVLSLALATHPRKGVAQDPPRAAVHLTAGRYHRPAVSATFHGRDLFAPAAAHLACGAGLAEMGEALSPEDLVELEMVHDWVAGSAPREVEVLHIDRFGNLITSLRLADEAADLSVSIEGVEIEGLSRTFADVARGAWLAYVGSSGHLEIAIREGRAAEALGLEVGALLRVASRTSSPAGGAP
jgi:S-adenosylmethionine hydrolase